MTSRLATLNLFLVISPYFFEFFHFIWGPGFTILGMTGFYASIPQYSNITLDFCFCDLWHFIIPLLCFMNPAYERSCAIFNYYLLKLFISLIYHVLSLINITYLPCVNIKMCILKKRKICSIYIKIIESARMLRHWT